MSGDGLGRIYQDGEVLLQQGGPGGRMYVVQEGKVEVVIEAAGKEVRLAVRGPGEFVGEMEVFDQGTCAATVRALGTVRALTIDKATMYRRIAEDPALALRLVQQMAGRVREVDAELIRQNSAAEARLDNRQEAGAGLRSFPVHRSVENPAAALAGRLAKGLRRLVDGWRLKAADLRRPDQTTRADSRLSAAA